MREFGYLWKLVRKDLLLFGHQSMEPNSMNVILNAVSVEEFKRISNVEIAYTT